MGGPVSWVGRRLRGSPGWGNIVSQVDGVSDMSPACCICGSLVGVGSEKGQWPLPPFLFGRKLSPSSCPDARPFSSSLCAWCLWSSNPGAGALREWVWVSPCVGSLRRTAWNSKSFFHWLNPHWVLQPVVMGTYLSRTGTLGREPELRLVLLVPEISPNFLSTTQGCRTSPFHVSTSPISLDGCGFSNSIVARLLFSPITDGSEWWVFYILV